jgi:acyl carrier protein
MTQLIKTKLLKDLEENVKNIIPSLKRNISPSEDLKNSLGLGSLDIVELVARLEFQYQIQIPDQAIEKFDSLETIAVYLERNAR